VRTSDLALSRRFLPPSSDYPEDGDGKLLQNVCNYLPINMMSYPRRPHPSLIMLQNTEITYYLYFVSHLWP
jgi:hypothetical protein